MDTFIYYDKIMNIYLHTAIIFTRRSTTHFIRHLLIHRASQALISSIEMLS